MISVDAHRVGEIMSHGVIDAVSSCDQNLALYVDRGVQGVYVLTLDEKPAYYMISVGPGFRVCPTKVLEKIWQSRNE